MGYCDGERYRTARQNLSRNESGPSGKEEHVVLEFIEGDVIAAQVRGRERDTPHMKQFDESDILEEQSAMPDFGNVIALLVILILVLLIWRVSRQRRSALQSRRQRFTTQESPTTTIDAATGEVVTESELAALPPMLPEDVIRLAARNRAFFEALRLLQRQQLDDDLFLQALEDLKDQFRTTQLRD